MNGGKKHQFFNLINENPFEVPTEMVKLCFDVNFDFNHRKSDRLSVTVQPFKRNYASVN